MKKFEKKVWLSSPTMHGPEIEYVKEAWESYMNHYAREYLNRTMPQYCEEVLKAKKILETVCESERK